MTDSATPVGGGDAPDGLPRPEHIPFNRPAMVGRELEYIETAVRSGKLAGGGIFTAKCESLLQQMTGTPKAMLTPSCTAALEMAAVLCDIGPGDEVIMPSFTFVSTANAFVLRGAVPVFVDVREDTCNLDEQLIEQAVTTRTKAIVPVHYAGVGCEMDEILAVAERHQLFVIEDAAHATVAKYKDRCLGTIGQLGALSFHETKNCISGEGGALLINEPSLRERAEIVREKGTDRSRFFRGEVEKYSWVDVGSSYLPSEVVAAFLCAQLEQVPAIDARREALYRQYRVGLATLEGEGHLRLPIVPKHCHHNGHMFHVLLADEDARRRLVEHLRRDDIHAVHHYVPLHSSPMGRSTGRVASSMEVTDRLGAVLLRLPMFHELSDEDQERIMASVRRFFS